MQIPVDFTTFEASDEAIPDDVRLFVDNRVIHPLADEASFSIRQADFPELSARTFTPQPVLDRWDVKTYIYKSEAAIKVGFLAGLFSGSGKRVAGGVIHEAKRFRVEKTESGRPIEIGVSVRLSVATTSVDSKIDLSIPNLAAQAQLGMVNARIGIAVIGFHGPIGDLLPAPEDLNVENFSVFTSAAKEIQKRVFGMEGVNFLSPTVLSFEENVP